MKNIIYEKPFLTAMRIFACVASVLLIVVTSLRIYNTFFTKQRPSDFPNIFGIAVNLVAIILFYLMIIHPQKIEYLAIGSFMYAFVCLTLDFDNPMGILMYGLGISVFYVRGLFIHKTRQKAIIAIIVYICLLCGGFLYSLLLHESADYFDTILEMTGYTLVLSIIIFLLITYNHFIKAESQDMPKILNLAEIPGLVETDVVLLQKVLENEQYKNIARAVYKAPGTIRNRLNKIYDLLGVMDRMGFISTYLGYEIVFEKE
ncbi:MAG: hypothetical protein J5710_08530 [Treponema sp.]|nr:hypothetical protein [Treponema sp.]